jgi:hypothetical protein
VRRKTRAGLKYVHVLEGADETKIEEYKEINREALDNPLAAVSDFFTNTKGGIDVVEGDARLAEIGDVEHHISTFFIGSPVPKSLVGYGEDLNRDVLEDQKKQYDRALDALTDWIDKEFLQPLIELQWLLKGIYPDNLTYEIERPTRNPITAADLKAAGEAVKALKESGVIATKLILQFLAKILPGLDPEEALRLLKEEQAENPAPTPPAPTGTPPLATNSQGTPPPTPQETA